MKTHEEIKQEAIQLFNESQEKLEKRKIAEIYSSVTQSFPDATFVRNDGDTFIYDLAGFELNVFVTKVLDKTLSKISGGKNIYKFDCHFSIVSENTECYIGNMADFGGFLINRANAV